MQIEDRERHRRMLLKALYKTRDPNRPIQDLSAVFEHAGLGQADGLAAARHLEGAGMLKWESSQEPGIVKLLHPGVESAEKILMEEKRASRLAFMRKAYQVVGGSTTKDFGWKEVGEDIGLDEDDALETSLHLQQKGLVESTTLPYNRITPAGADEVEQSINAPDQATTNLPAATTTYNVLVQGGVSGAIQLQQGSPGASQHQHVATLGANEIQLLETFVQEYRQQLKASGVQDEAVAEAGKHLAAIENELKSEQPNRTVIERSVELLKALGLGIGANFATMGIVAAYSRFT